MTASPTALLALAAECAALWSKLTKPENQREGGVR